MKISTIYNNVFTIYVRKSSDKCRNKALSFCYHASYIVYTILYNYVIYSARVLLVVR